MPPRRTVLGNDPFERGAALRPELQPEGKEPAPTPAPRPPAGERVQPERKGAKKRTRTAAKDATSNPPPTQSQSPNEGAQASAEAPPAERDTGGAIPAPFEEPSSPAFETTGERVRRFLERGLPQLGERLVRLASEGLGLVGAPEVAPEVDGFGMSEAFFARWQPMVSLVLDRYFRLVAEGIEHLPAEGPAILVCNHSGVLPYDEVLLEAAIAERHPAHRRVRPLTEDFAIHLPFAGSWLNRFGCVRACPENAERLLAAGQAIAVFPEGSHGIGKLYRDRYRLQRFGRGGFVKVALRAQAPVIPVALLGAEEANPVLARIDLPRGVGVPYLPVTPTFPWLGPLGLWPLPTRLFLRVGAPIHLGHSPRDAEDRPLVARLAEEVRAQVQELLDGMRAERRSVFF